MATGESVLVNGIYRHCYLFFDNRGQSHQELFVCSLAWRHRPYRFQLLWTGVRDELEPGWLERHGMGEYRCNCKFFISFLKPMLCQ